MYEYDSIDKIFYDIRIFILDYIKLIEIIHENNGSTMNIKIGKDVFYLPATLNEFSQRANQLQYCLQRQIRILAQKRRNEIIRGIESTDKQILNIHQYRFDDAFKTHLKQIETNLSDKNLHRIQVMIDTFELFTDPSLSKITFRLLPIIGHIQKQLCYISKNIQNILDNHRLIIEQHLRKLQYKLNTYDQMMKTKLSEYISRDIRPPMLVIPCPRISTSDSIGLHPRN